MNIQKTFFFWHTSTKFAQFPSSSIPRVLNRVPARFHPSREIKDIVAIIGMPFVGGAERGTVNIPTCPWMVRTCGQESITNRSLLYPMDLR